MITLADVEAVARAFPAERGSRWFVEVQTTVRAFESGTLYVTAEAWRAVDEDYDQKERVLLGAVLSGPGLRLAEGCPQDAALWIIKMARERGVTVELSPSVRALVEALG